MNVPAAFSFVRNMAWFLAGVTATNGLFALVLHSLGWTILNGAMVAIFVSLALNASREISRDRRR